MLWTSGTASLRLAHLACSRRHRAQEAQGERRGAGEARSHQAWQDQAQGVLPHPRGRGAGVQGEAVRRERGDRGAGVPGPQEVQGAGAVERPRRGVPRGAGPGRGVPPAVPAGRSAGDHDLAAPGGPGGHGGPPRTVEGVRGHGVERGGATPLSQLRGRLLAPRGGLSRAPVPPGGRGAGKEAEMLLSSKANVLLANADRDLHLIFSSVPRRSATAAGCCSPRPSALRAGSWMPPRQVKGLQSSTVPGRGSASPWKAW